MKILLVSMYLIINEGILSLLKDDYMDIQKYSSLDKAIDTLSDMDDGLLVYTLFKDSPKELDQIISLKKNFPKVKILIIDFTQEKNTFFKFSKSHIEGYILGGFNRRDFEYAINKIMSGKRFYDRELIYRIIEDEDEEELSHKVMSKVPLTKRENEILLQLATGLSNFEIACNLKISENTVKKHLSNLFIKINVSDRSQAIVYAYKIGLINKPVSFI